MVVQDWFAEIEDDGFGSCAVCVAMAVIVDGGIGVFGVVVAMGGRAHVGESGGKREGGRGRGRGREGGGRGCVEEKKVNRKPPCQMFI